MGSNPATALAGGRARRWAIAIGLALAAIVTLLLVAALLSARTPAWFDRGAASAPASGQGERAENEALTELTRVRPMARIGAGLASEPWELRISAEDVAAWMAQRLPAWAAHRRSANGAPASGAVQELMQRAPEGDAPLPAWLERVVVQAQAPGDASPDGPGVLRVGVRAQRGGMSQVLWVVLVPRVDEQGALWLEARAAGVGSVPVPVGMVARAMGQVVGDAGAAPAAGQAAARWERLLLGAEPLMPRAELNVDGVRKARVESVRVEEGAVVLRVRTVAHDAR